MAERFDLVITGGTVVFPWGREQTSIGIREGRIAGFAVPREAGAEVIEAGGLHVLPGLIDAHVHFRDPGDASVESIATGTRAALLGGLTAVFDMPNTTPPVTTAARLAEKREKVEREAYCDMGLYVGASRDNVETLAALEQEEGVPAIKVFMGSSTGSLLIEDDDTLERVMRGGRRRIAYHSEDEYRLRERRALFRSGDPYRCHAEWRDAETAFLGTRRLITLARRTRRPAHIVHVSTAEEFAYLAAHRDIATLEVLVNHLTQIAPECYDRLGPYAVMNPPIRERRHWEAAWAAVREGLVDTVGSDHAPHSRAAKERPWPETAAGLTGVQTLVPLMLDHVAAGRLSLERMVDLLAAGPARVFGAFHKGRIALGMDADFTLVDLGKKRRIEESWIVSPCGWTPFAGMTVTGWPVMTILRGVLVMREDEILGPPRGRLVRFAR
jgi:dihydroorotase